MGFFRAISGYYAHLLAKFDIRIFEFMCFHHGLVLRKCSLNAKFLLSVIEVTQKILNFLNRFLRSLEDQLVRHACLRVSSFR